MNKTSLNADEFSALCSTGKPHEIEDAIKNGADVNAADEYGHTPLMRAAQDNKNLEALRALIAAGADVNAADKFGSTPLMCAAPRNSPEALRTLIAAGADVNATGEYGVATLSLAALDNDNPEVLRVLLDAGADVNEKSTAASFPDLMYVAQAKWNVKALNVLMYAGDVIDAESYGWTPLMYAALNNNNPEILRTLIAAGADVNAKDIIGGTPLTYAAAGNENPEVLRTLIAAGADVNAKDIIGGTPLMYAAMRNGDPEALLVILAAVADASAKGMAHATRLTYAAARDGNLEALRMAGDIFYHLLKKTIETKKAKNERQGEIRRQMPEEKTTMLAAKHIKRLASKVQSACRRDSPYVIAAFGVAVMLLAFGTSYQTLTHFERISSEIAVRTLADATRLRDMRAWGIDFSVDPEDGRRYIMLGAGYTFARDDDDGVSIGHSYRSDGEKTEMREMIRILPDMRGRASFGTLSLETPMIIEASKDFD